MRQHEQKAESSMDDLTQWDEMDRHLAGEATSERVNHALRDDAEAAVAVQYMVSRLGNDEAASRKAQLWARLEPELTRRGVARSDYRGRRKAISMWIGGACAAALAIVAVTRRQAQNTKGVNHTYTTAAGEQAAIALADGSRVQLGPNSQLAIAAKFGKDVRTLELRGEANFVVTTNTSAPFIVRTGTVNTQVLGTEFSVRRYPAERVTQVSVTRGKVRASGARSSLTVTSGFIARVTDSSSTLQRRDEVDSYVDWSTKRLVFRRAAIPVVLAAVGDWYGYRFVVDDSTLMSDHVTASVRMSTLPETMAEIKDLLDVSVTIHDSTVVLHKRQAVSGEKYNRWRFPKNINRSMEVGR